MEGGNPGDLGEAGMSPAVLPPRGKTVVLQEPHQAQGAQQTEGILRGAPPGAWGIEGRQERPRGIPMQAQPHESGRAPGGREPAGVATQPAAQVGSERRRILRVWGRLGSRGGPGRVLLGQEAGQQWSPMPPSGRHPGGGVGHPEVPNALRGPSRQA